jgi:hypothetical protein
VFSLCCDLATRHGHDSGLGEELAVSHMNRKPDRQSATIRTKRSSCRCSHKTVEVPPLAAHPQGPCWMLLDPVGDHTRSDHGRSIANSLLGPPRRPGPVSVPPLMSIRKNPSCRLHVGAGLVKHARGCHGRHSSGHTALPRFLQYSDPGNSNAPGPLRSAMYQGPVSLVLWAEVMTCSL